MSTKWITGNVTMIFVNDSIEKGQNWSGLASKIGDLSAFVVFLLMALIGNTLVLVIIYRDSRRLRTNVNLFIANMAASDLLFPTFAVPYRISSILSGGKWIVHGVLGEALCKTVTFTGDISNLVSVLCLVAIAADRFDAIVYPMSSQRITKKVRSAILISTWFLPVLFFCPYFYAMKLRTGRNNATECLFTWGKDLQTTYFAQRCYIFVNFVCFILLPLLLLMVMYSLIIFSLFKQNSPSTTSAFSTEEQKQRTKENRQVVLMSFVVMLIFVAAFVPYNVYIFLVIMNSVSITVDSPFVRVSFILSVSYPAANPIVYFIFNEKYREGFHKLFLR